MAWLRPVAVIVSVCALAGCATAPTIQRWASVSGLPEPQPPRLRVSSAAATSPAELTVKSLPDHAGAAYIAAVAAKDTSAKQLRADVAKLIKSPQGGLQDGTVVDRVLTASVERPLIRPGDRLLMTRVTITPADPNVSFTNYESAAAAHTTVNIGAVTISDTYSAGASLGPTGGAASASASRTQGAARTINQDAVLSVTAQPRSLEIYRTGAEDRELVGDTLVKLSFRYGQFTQAPVHWRADADLVDDKTGAPLAPGKVAVTLGSVAFYPPRDLWVCAALDYEDREVADPRSADEGKQSVTIVSRQGEPAAYRVVPREDFQQLLWKIRDAHGSSVGFEDGLSVRELSFDDYDAAAAFLAWMKLEHPAKIKNGMLGENLGSRLRALSDFDHLELVLDSDSVGVAGEPPSCPKATP